MTDHKNCTGCGACVEICPQSAITTIMDKYKFNYPTVKNDLCNYCEKCLEVCPIGKPILWHDENTSFEQKYYIAASKKKDLLLHSHSGGIFYLLARKKIADGGVVYGCVFDSNRHPCHVRAENMEAVKAMRGFKPVQSDISDIYSLVKTDLECGTEVLFSGTPCQCDGLIGYLGKRYSNLLTVDMLCSGVTSEGVYNRYDFWLREQFSKLKLKMHSLSFENKQAFGHNRGLRIIFKLHKQRFLLSVPLEIDKLNSMSRRGIINRKSCGSCKYTSTERVGDITLGCFEKTHKSHPEFPYQYGASLVVISTRAGWNHFSEIMSEMNYEQSDYKRASRNHLLSTPTRESKNRKKIMTDIFRYGFDKAASEFRKPNFIQGIKILISSAFPDRLAIEFSKDKRKMKQMMIRIYEFVKRVKKQRKK